MPGTPVEQIIKALENFAREKGETIELILVGGLALSFYGGSRPTVDIDAEVKCSSRAYDELVRFLSSQGLPFNIGENISGWSIVPMPEGYRDRAKAVHESSNLVIKVLDPVDYIFAKLRRGTDEDLSDIREVLSRHKISKDALTDRCRSIRLPKDTETAFFMKRFELLLSEMFAGK